MFKFIDSSDNVIALRLTNTITGDDLNAIVDRVDDMMAKQDKVHVFVETHAIDGLQLSALPHHVSIVGTTISRRARPGMVAETGAPKGYMLGAGSPRWRPAPHGQPSQLRPFFVVFSSTRPNPDHRHEREHSEHSPPLAPAQ